MLASLDRWLLAFNRWMVVAMLAAMALMVFANVALRYLTDRSILWVDEASRYTMIWLVFIGAGLVLRHGGHVGIDTLALRLPRAAATIRGMIVALLVTFSCVMTLVGVRYATLTWAQTTPVLQIPVGAVYLAMPIGFALLIMHLLLMAHTYVQRGEVLAGGEIDADANRH